MALRNDLSLSDTEKKGEDTTQEILAPDPLLVTFQTPYDAENPRDWALQRKWTVTLVLSMTGFNRIMVSTIMAPAQTTMAQEFHMSDVKSVMALSVYLIATAAGPLLIGPLSEVYGRKPVLHATNIWFLAWNVICGFANSGYLLIMARLFAGFGASAIYALAGGVLGDVWSPAQRGRSLGLYILIPLLGAAVGPILGGVITQYTTWRWMFWATSILQAAMVLLSAIAFSETYAPRILDRRADALRKETGNQGFYTASERLDADISVSARLRRDLTRPLRLLIFHPIVQIMTILTGFAYGMTYLLITTLSEIWTEAYAESLSISGLHYLSLCFGEIIGAQIGGLMMDYFFRLFEKRSEMEQPEHRLPVLLVGLLISPIGLFIYGWTAQARSFWISVDIGALLVALGIQMIGQAVQGYVIDAYPEHASSASAAYQVLRGLAAAGFPLFAPSMYSALGYGWGNSLLAFTTLVIGLPCTLVVWIFGARLRQAARFSL